MWKPNYVVPENRSRATRVWTILLLAIVGYTVWQIVTLSQKFDNPTTSFSVSDDLYPFPKLVVCLTDGQGCDVSMTSSTCVSSLVRTVFDSCGEEDAGIAIEHQTPNCVALDLAQLDFEKFGSSCPGEETPSATTPKKPSATVWMSWFSSFDPLGEDSYSASVRTYLGEEVKDGYSTVPYNRVVYSSDQMFGDVILAETYMTIGKSVRKYLSAEDDIIYPTLTMSTADSIIQNGLSLTTSSNEYAIGYLYLTLTQGSFSLTELSDNNPLDIGAFLGNMGGFWELLLVTWGLCFIATRGQEPKERARDFINPIQKGKEAFNRKRRSLAPTVSSDQACSDEEQPSWDTAERDVPEGVQDGPGGSVGDISLANDSAPSDRTARQQVGGPRQEILISAQAFRRPIPQDNPIRSDVTTNSARSGSVAGRSMARVGEQPARARGQPPTTSLESL